MRVCCDLVGLGCKSEMAGLVVALGCGALQLHGAPSGVTCRATMARVSPLIMGKKTAFEEYTISGEGTITFPLPTLREATRAHKKFAAKGGVVADKAPKGSLTSILPELCTTYPGMRVLHLDPLVLSVDNFFSPEECDAYAALRDEPGATQMLKQSATFNSATAGARTSSTWFVRYQDAGAFLAKAASLLGRPVGCFEEPQLVWYQSGQRFTWHYDAVPAHMTANGGQRLATLLVYLNDVPTGGCTTFRDLQLGGTDASGQPRRVEVTPKKGRALLFFPSDAEGVPDERTLHAGEPTEHEKWIAQLWLHERTYTPHAPPGSSHEEAEAAVAEYARAHNVELPPNCFAR